MNRVSPQVRSIARLLAVSEAADPSATAGGSAVFPAIDRLRPHLAMLMGQSGFQALLSRALALASAEVHWLPAVRVTSGGELDGLSAVRETIDAASMSEGEIALLAHLLGLLVAFIGPALTLRLVSQIWPQLSIDDAQLDTADDEDAG